MPHSRLLLAITLIVQMASAPVLAQDSSDPLLGEGAASTPTTPSFNPNAAPTPSEVILDENPDPASVVLDENPEVNEVTVTQQPSGLAGTVSDLLGDGNSNTVNQTQQGFLDVLDYGQAALEVYRFGEDIYQAISDVIDDPGGVLGGALNALLDNYDAIGSKPEPAELGEEGQTSPIFTSPQTPAQTYVQAKNDVARRMYLPSLMTQLVFSEEARTLKEQQSEQLDESLTNTTEASTNLVQLSGGTIEAVAQNGDLALAVQEEADHAQTQQSSQAVLKSIAAADSLRARQTSANGLVLGNIQQSQVEQNRSTQALVVSSALAYQQRDAQSHLQASHNAFLEQIRADLGQQEDERQLAAFTNLEKQANATGNIILPGMVSDSP